MRGNGRREHHGFKAYSRLRRRSVTDALEGGDPRGKRRFPFGASGSGLCPLPRFPYRRLAGPCDCRDGFALVEPRSALIRCIPLIGAAPKLPEMFAGLRDPVPANGPTLTAPRILPTPTATTASDAATGESRSAIRRGRFLAATRTSKCSIGALRSSFVKLRVSIRKAVHALQAERCPASSAPSNWDSSPSSPAEIHWRARSHSPKEVFTSVLTPFEPPS